MAKVKAAPAATETQEHPIFFRFRKRTSLGTSAEGYGGFQPTTLADLPALITQAHAANDSIEIITQPYEDWKARYKATKATPVTMHDEDDAGPDDDEDGPEDEE